MQTCKQSDEALLMNIHNLQCFRGDIRKIFTLYLILSRILLFRVIAYDISGPSEE